MDRRDFLLSGAGAAALASSGTSQATASEPTSTQRRDGFQLLYAPHFGMFNAISGKDHLDQLLRLGPRNEHGCAQLQRQLVEVPVAEDVLHRHSRQPLRAHLLKEVAGGRFERSVEPRAERAAAAPKAGGTGEEVLC